MVVAGLFGGIIGYGLADVGCTGDCEAEKLLGTLVGSTAAAAGVGIVAVLVLRAMSEWKAKGSVGPTDVRRRDQAPKVSRRNPSA